MPEPVPPPMTELAAAVVTMHELFTAYRKAGFTERQALELLKAVMLHGVQDGNTE